MTEIYKRLPDAAKKVTAHRAKTVIDHIIKHGFITTEDLVDTYGYNHPPRAAGDVRGQGIPLEINAPTPELQCTLSFYSYLLLNINASCAARSGGSRSTVFKLDRNLPSSVYSTPRRSKTEHLESENH